MQECFTRVTCDRCAAVQDHRDEDTLVEWEVSAVKFYWDRESDVGERRLELCSDCAEALNKWLCRK